MILSILICTVYERAERFKLLYDYLKKMNKFTDVEVLYEVDNKEISVGAKRQKLLERAKGKFIVFIDDDDTCIDTYIKDIREAILGNPDIDCIGSLEECFMNGQKRIACHSNKYSDWGDNIDGYNYVRTIYHKDPVKRELALKAGFKDMRFAEDHDYARRLKPLLKNEVFLDKVMQIYRYTDEPHNKKYGIKG